MAEANHGDLKRRRLVYRTLGMPDALAGGTDPEGGGAEPLRPAFPPGWVFTGYFLPADSLAAVEALTLRRIRGISRLLALPGLYEESRSLLYRLQFHTFEDFLLVQAHGKPTRKDGIHYGQSLTRFTPDLAGYLQYLEESAPALARFLFRPLPVAIPLKQRQRHCEIVGQTGWGKSVYINTDIHALSTHEPAPTIFLIEPHGDLAKEVSRSKYFSDPERQVHLDPYLDSRYSFTINPFHISMPDHGDPSEARRRVRKERIDLFTQVIIDVMREIFADDTDLTRNMDTLIRPCISALLDRRGNEAPRTFVDLMRFMNDDRNALLVERGRQSMFPMTAEFFANDFYKKEWQATKRALGRRAQALLNMETFFRVIVGNGFSTVDLEQEINSRKLIVVRLTNRLGDDVIDAVGRFVLAMVRQYARLREEGRRVPIYLYVDEFPRFAVRSMTNAFAEDRKFGIHYTVARQFKGQGTTVELERAIEGNTAVSVFGMSKSLHSRQKMAEVLGIDLTEFERLQTGQFFIKAGNMPPFLNRVPEEFADKKNFFMTEAAWEKVKRHQLTRYYRPLDEMESAPLEADAEAQGSEADDLEMAEAGSVIASPAKPLRSPPRRF